MTRTKQQTACDGVRTAWQSDAFTQILHQQVTAKFSMDGIIPTGKPTEAPTPFVAQSKTASPKNKPTSIQSAQKKLGTIVGNMDGIRIPWKHAHAS